MEQLDSTGSWHTGEERHYIKGHQDFRGGQILGGDELSKLPGVLHVRPTMGDSREARNLERAYVGEDTKDMIERRGTSGL